MSKNIAISAIGGILVASTVGVFLMQTPERAAVHWWSLGFLLFAEVVVCAGLVWMGAHNKTNLVMERAGLSVTLSLYFLGTLLLAVFAGKFHENIGLLLTIEGLLTAAAAIISVAIAFFAGRAYRIDQRAAANTEPKRGGY